MMMIMRMTRHTGRSCSTKRDPETMHNCPESTMASLCRPLCLDLQTRLKRSQISPLTVPRPVQVPQLLQPTYASFARRSTIHSSMVIFRTTEHVHKLVIQFLSGCKQPGIVNLCKIPPWGSTSLSGYGTFFGRIVDPGSLCAAVCCILHADARVDVRLLPISHILWCPLQCLPRTNS